jgi:MscS family membrane protein
MNIIDQLPFLKTLPPETLFIVTQFIVIVITLAVIYVLRRVIKAIIFAPLKRWAEHAKSPLAPIIYEALERPSRLVVFSVGIYLTVLLFDFGLGAEDLALGIARGLLILAAFVALYSLIDVIFSNHTTLENLLSIQVEERLIPFLRTIIKVVVLVIGGLVILQEFGVNITALLASFGVVGLALSLAAQDTASNIFSFAAIVSDNPFKVGDYISATGFSGTIEHVGVRSSRIRKLDQTLVIVPNNLLTSVAVDNWSRLHKRRLDFLIYFEYETTTAQIREATERISEMMKARELIDPYSVIVRFVTFSQNSLDVRVICYVMLADWNAFVAEQEQINLNILDITRSLGIAMGRQSLFIENFPEYEQPVPRILKPSSFLDDDMPFVPPSDFPNQANS